MYWSHDKPKPLGPPDSGYGVWAKGLPPRLRAKEKFRRWALVKAERGWDVPFSLIFHKDSVPGHWIFEFICWCYLWDDDRDRGTQLLHLHEQELEGGTFKCAHCERKWLIHTWKWSSASNLKRPFDPRTAYCYLAGRRSRVSFLMDTE